jgi:alpha-galactosidase
MYTNRVIAVMFLTAICVGTRYQAAPAAEPVADFHVAPDGRDANPGTAAAPFATLARARDAVRQKVAAGLDHDVLVLIRGGTYQQAQTLVFGPEDSGTAHHSITYAAAPGERVVVSGGRKITGWKRGEGAIWNAELPEVKAGQWYFRQLFVNGRRAMRARTPNHGEWWKLRPGKNSDTNDATITVGVDHPIPAWKNVSDVEVNWINNNDGTRKRLGSVNAADHTFTLPPPHMWPHGLPGEYNISFPSAAYACYFENAREMLDQPGEWYLDRTTGVLSYWPREGEDLAQAEVVAPVVQKTLLAVQGTPERPVRSLHFQGLRVAHVDRPLPPYGFAAMFGCLQILEQTAPEPAKKFTWIEAAVSLKYARNCSLSGGAIEHAGGIGISLLNGCSENAIEGNELHELGGGGITAGGIRNRDTWKWADPLAADEHLGYRIVNNHVHDCGLDYYGAIGIFLGATQEAIVAHNLIHDIAYCGIVVSGNETPLPPFARNNTVKYNHIHDVMKVAVDGAGIYVSFPQAGWGASIRGNLIHDLRRNPANPCGAGPWSAAGIYLDGVRPDLGCRGYRFEENVVYRTEQPLFFCQCSEQGNVWRDNSFLGQVTPPPEVLERIQGQAGPRRSAAPKDALAQKAEWVRENLLSTRAGAPLPFSFTLDGKPSGNLLRSWPRAIKETKLDDPRTQRSLTWTDPQSGLEVRCDAVEYADFPTVEWTLHLRNTGAKPTPLIAGIQALDVQVERERAAEFVLHHHTGDNCTARSYEPHATRLEPRSQHAFAPAGGRPTNGAYPYFNVEYDGGGLIAVIGWPGQWAARFERDDATALHIAAGQELTKFKLLPGEEVRSPLVALQFWKGDRIRSQNVWRRWMIAHNLPRPGGKLPPPFTSACMGLHQSEASEVAYIDAYLKGGVKLDYWWMDAGWYPCRNWWETGTWEPDPQRFPKGIRAVADYAHAKGQKLVLWFEPERVHAGSWLFEKHPEWLLGKGPDRLLNLGHPGARQWLTQHVDRFLTEQGIDLYRQDHNIDPLGFWRANDAEDRQGITEIRHVEGYLAYWDELRRRHPNMLIDSCASGGRRNDLETLRRAVPLLRSDFQAPVNPNDPTMLVGNQGHTYGLSFWVPYYGTGVFYDNVYAVRSHLTPAFGIGYPAGADKVDWAQFRRRIEDWKQVAEDFYGDYYPLTPYTLSEKDWIAWQFHQPEAGRGMVQAFRHARSDEPSQRLKLGGLEAEMVYECKDLDREVAGRARGRSLMEQGLLVTLPRARQAALLSYRSIPSLAAVIGASRDTCEVLEEVAFSAQDSRAPRGEIAEYRWDFGDGSSAAGSAAAHAYATAGSYTIKLTVQDRHAAADTTSTTLTVTPPDTTPPALIDVASGDPEKVVVIFNKPVERASAETAANYAIDQGVRVFAAALGPDRVTVSLKTSPLRADTDYALSVNNVRDRARTVHTIAPNSRQTFRYTGLYAWWKLNDGQGDVARDFSGNGHHGTLLGSPAGPKWVSNDRGPALSFSGKGDYVERDTFFPDLAMPFSITLWVNPAATQVEHADIFGNHGEPFVGLSLQQDRQELNSYGFGFGDGRQWQGAGCVQLKANQWQHIAVVCDGEKTVLYVGGVAKSQGSGKGPVAPNPGQNFKLGQGYHSGRYFQGLLSDVRVHRKALSSAEIEQLATPSRKP